MGSHIAKPFPSLPVQPKSIHDLSGHPNRLPTLNNPAMLPGRRTLPISGAPRGLVSPAVWMFRQRHKK